MALRGTLTHRKTRKLAMLLKIDPPAALGYEEALFHVTAENAPAGDIGRMSNADIATEMFVTKFDPDRLIEALTESGWLDKSEGHRLIVHDWSQHSDDSTDIKLARSGQIYADGARPRMSRLSAEERGRICAFRGWEFHEKPRKAPKNTNKPQQATESHKEPQNNTPVPVPVPVPVPEPDPEPVPVPPKGKILKFAPSNQPDEQSRLEAAMEREGIGPGRTYSDPYQWFEATFNGEIPADTWIEFGRHVQTTTQLLALLDNLPLWMKTAKWANGGFTPAGKYLANGTWLKPPKESQLQNKHPPTPQKSVDFRDISQGEF